MIVIRPMTEADLVDVATWLNAEHVARSWLTGTSAAAKLAVYRDRVLGRDPLTTMYVVVPDREPIGFCQSYRWGDHPSAAAEIGAGADEIGIDYAIGIAALTGRGVGGRMIAALVGRVRREHPGVGIVTDPAVGNVASRRVLESNGFDYVATFGDRAVYRLAPAAGATVGSAGVPATVDPAGVPAAQDRLGRMS